MVFTLPYGLVAVQNVAQRVPRATTGATATRSEPLEAEIDEGEANADDAEGDERKLLEGSEDEAERKKRPGFLIR